MAKISGPDFITLLVNDLEASYKFYKETLGLPDSPERQPNAYAFATTPCPMAVRQSPARRDSEKPGDGIIVWMRADDATALHAELTKQGVVIVDSLRQSPWGMTFSLRDPDGYVIAVHDGG